MNPESTHSDPTLAEPLFDSSAEWFKVARPQEPDFSVDGLHRASMLERILAFLRRRDGHH